MPSGRSVSLPPSSKRDLEVCEGGELVSDTGFQHSLQNRCVVIYARSLAYQPRHVFGRGEGPVQLAWRERGDLQFAAKQPAPWAGLAPILPQQVQQAGRQHGLAITPALAVIDMDQRPVAIDILDLEIADLGCPEPRALADPERRAIFEPRPGNRGQQGGNFLDANDYR